MPYNKLKTLVTTGRLLAITKLSALILVLAAPVAAQTVIPVAPFRAIELHDGGHVSLRQGPVQRVTLIKGSTDCAQLTVADDHRLVIDKYNGRCVHGYELEIEIVTPSISEISVANGGIIQTRGSFPRQAEITTDVSNGGIIDIRSIAVDRVTASIAHGGRILVMPQITLSASVSNGGGVTYWGDPQVQSSVSHGGAITKGSATEADKPLSELNPSIGNGCAPAGNAMTPRGRIF